MISKTLVCSLRSNKYICIHLFKKVFNILFHSLKSFLVQRLFIPLVSHFLIYNLHENKFVNMINNPRENDNNITSVANISSQSSFSWKWREALLMQYLSPVGPGPSYKNNLIDSFSNDGLCLTLKTWPRCAWHLEHSTSVLSIPNFLSDFLVILSVLSSYNTGW